MPNVVKTDIHLKEESKENKHPEIPVKNKQNDAVKNTAEEPGLNEARSIDNELEPGIDKTKQGSWVQLRIDINYELQMTNYEAPHQLPTAYYFQSYF